MSFKQFLILTSIIYFFVFGIIVEANAVDVSEKTKIYSVIGTSRIFKDVPSARSAAVSDCLTSAIENAAIDLFPYTTLSEKFGTISMLLSSYRNEFIQDYKVIKEVKTEKNYRVLVQVRISLEKFQDLFGKAGMPIIPEDLPEILFLVAEQNVDDLYSRYWWHVNRPFYYSYIAVTPMKRALVEKGFSIIDHEIIPVEFFTDITLGDALADHEAITLGSYLNADLVVVGHASARTTQNRLGETIRTYQGNVSVKAIMVKTGEMIASTTTNTISAGSDMTISGRQAMSEAGKQAGRILTSQILTRWQEMQLPPGNITLYIKGSYILPNLVVFRNTLKSLEKLKRQKTMEMTANEAVLSLFYEGSAEELAESILLNAFDGFGVNIYEVADDHIKVELNRYKYKTPVPKQ